MAEVNGGEAVKFGTQDFNTFKETLYRTGGDLMAAIGSVDPAAAESYRADVAERVSHGALAAAASYAPNIAAAQLNAMGIQHPLA